jgi:hypothetical protein
MIQTIQAYLGPLGSSLLTFKGEWRKLKVDVCLKVELEEELDWVLCFCLEERACRCVLEDII